LLENKFAQKLISTSPYPNPKAQYYFRTDEMTSFFEQMYR